MRGPRAVVAGLLAELVVAGCASTVTGSAAVATGPTHDGAPTTAPSSTTGVQPADYTPKQLCSFLTATEAASLGLPGQGRAYTLGGQIPSCEYRNRVLVMNIGYRESGTKDLLPVPDSERSDIQISSRKAVQLLLTTRAQAGECHVFVDLAGAGTISASVAILSAGEGKVDGCGLVRQVATLVTSKIK